MTLDHYYYITSLPCLGELGSVPPLGLAEVRDSLDTSPERQELVESLFLLEDLLQREAYLAGELPEAAPAVLSEKQVRDESPLPAYLATEGEREAIGLFDSGQSSPPQAADRGNSADRLWESYFRHVAGIAKKLRCGFLTEWVRFEVALRNALSTIRARRLGIDENAYLVASDLAAAEQPMEEVLSEWEAASSPLAGQQVLLRARWAWLAEHDGYYRFRNDELAAYALRLMLLIQWQRICADERTSPQTEGVPR